MKRLLAVLAALVCTHTALHAQGLGASQLILTNSSGGGVILQPDPGAVPPPQLLTITPPPSPFYQLVYTPPGWIQNQVVKWTSNTVPSLGNSLIYDDGTNVGIGTTSPSALLHVAGTGQFDGQLTVTAGGAAITGNVNVAGNVLPTLDDQYDLGLVGQRWRTGRFGTSVVVGTGVSLLAATNEVEFSGGAGRISVVGANDLIVRTNGVERLRVLGSGEVGIGTASPVRRLHVEGPGGGISPVRLGQVPTGLATDDVVVLDGSGDVKRIGAGALIGNWAWLLGGNTLSGTEKLGSLNAQPLIVVTNNVERLRVTAGGDVGIGTATPAERLDVVGNVRFSGA
ncbi:MAG: hypothetical protein NZ960_08550, partial [Candidatus Kapabacteria bacterium]|nr:hypothetical protein [Candidatus Kapabacteria bacterium]